MAIVSISIDADVLAKAQARGERLGYKSFSAYAERVLYADVTGGEAHVLREDWPSSTSDPVEKALGKVVAAASDNARLYASPQSKPKPARPRRPRLAPGSKKK